MKALLWKEYRELRGLVALWLVSLVIVQALARSTPLTGRLPKTSWGSFRLSPRWAAIAIGSELLSRERQSKTLDYLLTRPIGGRPPGLGEVRAGSAALFLLVGALLILWPICR